MSIDLIPRIKKHVTSRNEEFGLLIFTNRTPILAFNTDSTLIWEKIDGKKTIRDICESLMRQNSSDVARTQKSVNDFLDACVKLDLIEM